MIVSGKSSIGIVSMPKPLKPPYEIFLLAPSYCSGCERELWDGDPCYGTGRGGSARIWCDLECIQRKGDPRREESAHD